MRRLNMSPFIFVVINSNAIVMLEKQHEINQKAFDKIQKASDELLRERDAIHKELKKTESMCLVAIIMCTNLD